MIKRFLLISILFAACPVFAEYSYVSPETYAVNEADLLDYMNIPRSPKPSIDDLANKRKINKNIEKSYKPAKEKRVKDTKPYEETLIYKSAKWWVDQRYKREEEHHGARHEIKVQTRIEKEKQAEEKKVVDN